MFRTYAIPASILAILSLGILAGCAGSGNAPINNGGGFVNNAKFTVAWPARSRELQASASALSFRFVMTAASQTGTDVVFTADRPAATGATNAVYTIPQAIKSTGGAFTISFYAAAGQTGEVVGEATANAGMNGPNLIIGTVQLEGTITKVIVPATTVVIGDEATQLTFTAEGAEGNTIAVTPGSAQWRLADGATFASITADGKATGIASGTAHAIAKVDGVDSNSAALTVQDVAAQITSFAIKPFGTISDGWQVIGDTGIVSSAGQSYLYDFPSDTETPIPAGKMSPNKQCFPTNFFVEAENTTHAGVRLNGPNSPVVDLHPGGFSRSTVYDLTDTFQVGEVAIAGGGYHAARWAGSSGSFVDMHPGDAFLSTAACTFGSISGGSAYYLGDGRSRAMLWNGTAGTNIHPTTWDRSGIGTMGRKYAGGLVTNAGGDSYACTWNHAGGNFAVLDSVDAGARIYELGREGLTEDFAVGKKQYSDFKEYAVIWHIGTRKFINLDLHTPFAPHLRSKALSFTALPDGTGFRVIGTASDPNRAYAVAWTIPNEVLETIRH